MCVCTGRWFGADCVLLLLLRAPCSARVCLGYVHRVPCRCAACHCAVVQRCGESWAKPRQPDQRCSPPCSGHQSHHHQLCHRYWSCIGTRALGPASTLGPPGTFCPTGTLAFPGTLGPSSAWKLNQMSWETNAQGSQTSSMMILFTP